MSTRILIVTLGIICILPNIGNCEELLPRIFDEPATIHDAIEDIKPDLLENIQAVKKLILHINKNLLNISLCSRATIAEYGEKIKNETNLLESKISLAPNQTESTEDCIKLGELNLNSFLADTDANIDQLYTTLNTNTTTAKEKLRTILRKAYIIKETVFKVIAFCIKQYSLPWQVFNLDKCLKQESDYLKRIIINLGHQATHESNFTSLYAKISADLETILGQARNHNEEFETCLSQLNSQEKNETPTSISQMEHITTSLPSDKTTKPAYQRPTPHKYGDGGSKSLITESAATSLTTEISVKATTQQPVAQKEAPEITKEQRGYYKLQLEGLLPSWLLPKQYNTALPQQQSPPTKTYGPPPRNLEDSPKEPNHFVMQLNF